MSETQDDKIDLLQEQVVPKTFLEKMKANCGKCLAYIIAGWAGGEVGAGIGLLLGGIAGGYIGGAWGAAGTTGGAGLGGLIGAIILWLVGVSIGAACVWCINSWLKRKK